MIEYLKKLQEATTEILQNNPQASTLRIIIQEEERIVRRCTYRVKSAEAKLKRVDPVSKEFEETAELLENILDEIAQRRVDILRFRQRIDQLERDVT